MDLGEGMALGEGMDLDEGMALGEDMALEGDMGLEWGCLMAILMEACLMQGLHHMLTEEHLQGQCQRLMQCLIQEQTLTLHR